MVALLVLAGPFAMVAVLLVVRRRAEAPLMPRLDHGVARACAVAAVAIVAAWPSATLRGWLGYVDPDQCLGKDKPLAPAPGDLVDIESLKSEVRQQSLDVGPTLNLEAVGARELDVVTGPGSSGATDERWNVGGTDLGHPFVLDGRLGLVFGDTFAVPEPSGPGWRSNVLAWVDQPTQDQLVVSEMVEAPGGAASELLGSLKINGWEQTVIPTNTVVVGERIVMHYMSIACWGAHGRWAVRQSGLAVSDDGGQHFRRVPRATWAAGSGFAQVAFVTHEDRVYAFGIPEGRDGPVRLARVEPGAILDVGTWRYWDGEGWSADEADAVQVVPPTVGELSVAWNPYHQQWIMMYLDDLRRGIVMRGADQLTGPWSRARLVASSVEFPSLYAPFLLPGTGEDEEIRFTMSRFTGYNVVLMGARLEEREPTRRPR
jgi:hypothetical protein